MNKGSLKIALTLMSILAILGAGSISVGLIFHINILSYVGYAVFIVGILFLVMFAVMLTNSDKEVYISNNSDNKTKNVQQQEYETDYASLTKPEIMEFIKEDGVENTILDKVQQQWQDDEEIVLAAVEARSENFKYASNRLKNNMEIALAAFDGAEFKEDIILQTGDELKNTYEYFEKVIELGGEYIESVAKYASEKLRNSKKFAKLVLAWNGEEIQYFSEEIKNDQRFVELAVENGAPISKSTNKDALLAAVKKSPHFLDDKNELLNDKEFILKVAEFYGDVYKVIPNILKFDKDFMLGLIKYNKKAADVLPKKLLADEDYMKKVNKIIKGK